MKILILEDDLETLSVLMKKLSELDKNIAVTVFSEYTQVIDYLNKIPRLDFDVVLLDRDCQLGGSFHILDIQRFGLDKIIAISSVPEYNEQLRIKGVTKIVQKDYNDLETFAKKTVEIINELVI
jgi:DNA-binding response OmpR family regulator